MGRVIAIANQKGGVGKTTTTINLSACLAEKGKKILVIDTDPQGNTTSGFGLEKNDIENTIYELLLGEISIEESIIKNAVEGVDCRRGMTPSSPMRGQASPRASGSFWPSPGVC